MTVDELYEFKYHVFMLFNDEGNEYIHKAELIELLGNWRPWGGLKKLDKDEPLSED